MKSEPIEFLFITPAALFKYDGRVTSSGASARLGSLMPTYALAALGYDSRTSSISGGAAPIEAAVLGAKRVVFGEMFGMPGGWDAYRSLLRLVKDPGRQVVFSIADDHFDDPEALAFYQEALPGCLAVTTVSEELAQTVRRLTSRPVYVAPEPYEGLRGAPYAITARKPSTLLGWLARRIGLSADIWRLRLLWFGYPMNLPPLLGLLPGLEALSREVPLLLHCVTTPTAELNAAMTPARMREDAPLRMQFTPWSPLIMDSVLAHSDMVLIPSDYQNPVKRAKSPNRLVAGLHAGRFVVAHPLPAYAPYAQFAWIGEDLCEGIEWAIGHPREVIERIARGQAYIDERHSAEAVARFWLDVFELEPAPGAPPPAPPVAEEARMKLNLGCGDKILAGYVNVDVAPARAGRRPDVISDLRKLEAFESDSADEVLAVHVVEHFWRWEVAAVLREWTRVLRPGGKMILECPNLRSACEQFLADPEQFAGPGPEGQRTMWVFYGDPRWQDPLMVHRWGYTPQSLAAIMQEAGLEEVRQEPAQFKLREPRDMRLVGTKPKK